MGADLYIQSIVDDEPEKGKFRDSYNMTCVLCSLGLSWREDVLPRMDEDAAQHCLDLLMPDQAQWLLNEVCSREICVHPAIAADMGASLLEGDLLQVITGIITLGEVKPTWHPIEWWEDYYRQKRTRLIAFLERAIELNEPIVCSL